MSSRHLFNFSFITVIVSMLLVFFQNCGIRTPQVENDVMKSVGVTHSPIPKSCISCHSSEKPTSAVTISLDPKSNLFFHTATFGGDGDCVLCHTQVPDNVGQTWKGGLYNHKLAGGTKVDRCTECHIGNMPNQLVGAENFDHVTIGTQDCFECHKNSGANWSTAAYSHTPIPTSCNNCHNSDRPASSVFYPSLASKPGKNLYVHAQKYNGSSDCANCHLAVPENAGTVWSGAKYNHMSDLNAQVKNCTECHLGEKPTGKVGISQFDHATMGAKDCFECHTNAGQNWSLTTFTHSQTLTACISCHTTDKPAVTLYIPSNPAKPNENLYAHSTAFNGQADCVQCHMKVPTNVGVRWSGGYFNHKDSAGIQIATCSECHEGSRPSTHMTPDYAGNCVQCHTDPTIAWAQSGQKVPTNVTYLTPTTVSWGQVTTAHPNPTSQTGMTCVTCHGNYNATLSIKAFDHSAMPSGTKCYSCHLSGQQVVNTSLVKISTKTSTHESFSQTKDCNTSGCHNTAKFVDFKYPTWSATTKTFSGGKWK